MFKENLFLFDERLVIANDSNLKAYLLDKIYQLLTNAYPDIKKTIDLLSPRYY